MKISTAVFACFFTLCVAALSYKAIDATQSTIVKVIDWPKQIAAATKDLFHATTTVSSTSITLKQEEIAELALIQRKTLCITKFDTISMIGTHSTVIIRGEFTVKAGYDLNKGCKINFDEASKVVKITLPPVSILSIETGKQTIFYLHEGVGNPVDPAEMEKAYSENSSAARKEAEELGVTREANFQMQQRVRDIFRGLANEVIINEQPITIPKL